MEKKYNINKLIPILRLALGFIFIVTALMKLYDVASFSLYLDQYAFIIYPSLIAKFVIVLELLLGIFLINDFYTEKAVLASGLLILVFWFISISNLLNTTFTESCQCFGPLNLMDISSTYHFIFLSIMTISLMIIIRKGKDKILLSKLVKNALNGTLFLTTLLILIFANTTKIHEMNSDSLMEIFKSKAQHDELIKKILEQGVVVGKDGENKALETLIESEKNVNIVSFFAPTQCFTCLQYIKQVSKKEFRDENNFETKFIIFNTTQAEVKYFLKNHGIENYKHLYFLNNSQSLSGNTSLYEITPNVMFVNNSLEILGNYSAPRDPKYDDVFISFLVKRYIKINNEALASF
ncbi:MAG TPA: DoxX family protein [Bacteroidales bacterium]|nr:DoxX family protein [Bacteroidales bacterium]